MSAGGQASQAASGAASDICARLRQQLRSLGVQLDEDVAHLHELENTPGTAPSVLSEWQRTVDNLQEEIEATRLEMLKNNCGSPVPPPPPPTVVFTEAGPTAIVDGSGKYLGGGAVVDLAAHPSDAAAIFAATAGGGVWRTSDATAASLEPTWTPCTDQLPSSALGAVAFAPGDSTAQTVFAGTGTFASWPPTGLSVGLYKSTDGGDTWRVTGTSDTGGFATLAGRRIRHIAALSPPQGAVVLVGARDDVTVGGVFRSTDDGENFTAVSGAAGTGLPAGEGWALVEDPVSPGRVYAAVGGSAPGVYRSDDAGAAWTPVTAGISPADLSGAVWIRLALRPGRIGARPLPGRPAAGIPSTLFAGIVNGSGKLGSIYTTPAAPGRESWKAVPLPPGGPDAINSLGEGRKKFAMAADPAGPFLYVAGDYGGVWRAELSEPTVPTWTRINAVGAPPDSNVPDGAPHVDAQAFTFDADGDLLAGNDGGVYRLRQPRTGTSTWVYLGAAMANIEVLGASYDTLSGTVTVGDSDNGVAYQSSPSVGGVSLLWGDGGGQAADNNDPATTWRYAMSFGGAASFAVSRFQFGAANELLASNQLMLASPASPAAQLSGLSKADAAQNATFVTNQVAANQLLLGQINVYETADGGATARSVVTRPTDPQGIPVPGSIAMVCGGQENGVNHPEAAYVGIGPTLWARAPGGTAFSEVPAYPGGTIKSVAMDRFDYQRLYVIDDTDVYRSLNAGQTWTSCTGNLLTQVTDVPGNHFGQVLVYRREPTDVTEAVFVGAAGGVFQTLTASARPTALWTRFGHNLPRCIVSVLTYYPPPSGDSGRTGDVLLVGLQGRGVWLLHGASHHLLVQDG